MAAELLKLHIGAEMVHVPYKGSGPAMADLVAGRVTMAFSTITAALPFIRDGRLRALATTGSSRPAALADIPTAEEQGLAQFQVTFWTALFAPAGVSRAVMGQLNAQVQQALDNPDLRVAMSRVSEVPARTSLEAASTWVSDEYSQWSRVVNEAHLSASP
jgi:tripartite-type tricarboxylate transporter receptor subunit TctC